MVTTRSRTRDTTDPGYHELWASGALVSHTVDNQNSMHESMQDVTGDYGGDHALVHSRYESAGCIPINGKVVGGFYDGSNFTNQWPYQAYSSHVATASLTNPSAAQILARTNPNHPSVSPLSLMQDFYDVPRSLRDLGSLVSRPSGVTSPKNLAKHNLGVQFGWLPFVTDVKKVLQTQARVEHKFKELRRLYDTGGISRRVFIDSQSAESTQTHVALVGGSPVGIYYADIQKFTTARRWSCARWKLLSRAPESWNYGDMHGLAWKVANGLTPTGILEGAWDLVPWSWLVDWFTDAADFVIGNYNQIPVTPASCCTMTETKTRITFTRNPSTSSNYYSQGGGTSTYLTQLRVPVVPGLPTAFIPGISWDDVSILGSLAIQRFL